MAVKKSDGAFIEAAAARLLHCTECDGSTSLMRLKEAPGLEMWFMPLLTLGQATAAQVRLIVWCRACQHRFEPDNAELVEQHGPETTVLTWSRRLCCTECGERDAE